MRSPGRGKRPGRHHSKTLTATTVAVHCDAPWALQLRSREFAGSAGRASGGWVVGRQRCETTERCECCPGCSIPPGEPVFLVEASDGLLLVVCADCVGVAA